MITSLQNDKVKLAHALQTSAKSRRKESKIVLEGIRLVRDALQAGHQPLFALVSADFHDEALVRLLTQKNIDLTVVSDEVMHSVSDTQQPQGIVTVFPMPKSRLPSEAKRILVLDAIRDPGNMGTILRTAAAAGVEGVLLAPTCADPYNPKALRGGMGAHFRVPILEATWEQISEHCYNGSIYIADSEGDLAYDTVDWTKSWALIIGSEAHGAGDEAQNIAHHRVYIPMATNTESLNAAIAAGIILFEAARQR